MDAPGVLLWIGLGLSAAASFFFALAETALFALGKWRAAPLRNHPRGAHVLRLLEHPSELLGTIVLGNTLANATIVALALGPVFRNQWDPLLTLLCTTLFILAGCEVLPKTLAVRNPQHWSLQIARPMAWLLAAMGAFQSWVQSQINHLLARLIPKSITSQQQLTEEDFQELFEMATLQGTVGASEKEIILRIIQLDRKTAKDVMKPRSRLAAIPDDLSIEDMIAAARKYKHRRLPIYDETPDTIVGILNTKALLLNPVTDLSEVMEFPSFVPETMNLLQLLISLQRQQRGLAIVLDEYGGTAGLVTLGDILEEVVGEIQPEEPAALARLERLDPDRWRVQGSYRLEDFRREYPPLGTVPNIDTLGGLVLARFEEVPQPGQSIQFRGLQFTVLQADERRIQQILVERVKRK